MTRAAAAIAVVAAVVAVAFLLFGGPGSYTVTGYFENASQLTKGNWVEVGGNRIGSITRIRLARNGYAAITMRIDRFAPLRLGTTAAIRTRSLTGVAARYVSLSLGPATQPAIPDGGTIGVNRTTSVTELDQLFSTFPERTRESMKQVVKGFDVQLRGRSVQAGRAIYYLNPALAGSTAAIDQVVADQPVFRRFLTDTADLVSTLSSRSRDLTALVGNANAAAGALGDENVALGRSLELLPPVMRQANTTFVDLRSTLDDLDPLVAAALPATRRLAPLLAQVLPLVTDARPTVADLADVISTPGPANDLTDVFRQAPQLASLTDSASPHIVRALRKAQPVIDYARPYTPELVGWFTKFGQVPSLYDANGHYARIQPMFNAFQLQQTPAGSVLVQQPPSQRLAGLQTLRSQRCPGGALQPPPDGSAPWVPTPGFDCDPSTVPPGP